MGFVRKNLGFDLTGGGQEDAAREAAGIQAEAGERAIEFGREQLQPFVDVGQNAAGRLAARSLHGSEAQEQITQFGGFQSPEVTQFGGFNLDPSRVLNNPLFKALAQQQEQRLINQQGALGRGGSGETSDLLTQNVLRLGAGFQDRDINQQQQAFQNLSQSERAALQREQQGFQNQFQTETERFNEQLQRNQLRFGQTFDIARLGANAGAQQATSGQNIIQGIGNAESAVPIVGGNNSFNLGQQLIGGFQGAALGGAGALGPGIGGGTGFLAGLG